MLRLGFVVRHLLGLVGLFGGVLALPAAAIAAEPAPCAPNQRCETPATGVAPAAPKAPVQLAILAHFGVATPVGAVGLSVDLIPLPYLAVGAGVGTNLEGPEFEAGARLRLPVPRGGYLTLGSGWSVSHYTGHQFNGLAGFERVLEGMAEGRLSYAVWQHAHFWNNELGVDGSSGPVFGRFYVGYARLLNTADYTCTEGDFPCTPKDAFGLVYLGTAIGVVF
jgi:hypothetical protein